MDQLKTFWAQLWQWPPTSSTVYGGSLLAALGMHALTGSWETAGLVGGVLSALCPQDAPAINKAIQQAETLDRDIATAPKA